VVVSGDDPGFECCSCRQFWPREDVTIVSEATGLVLCRKCRPMWRCACGRVEYRSVSMEQHGKCSECAG
jgi:hypothetical protein